MFRIATAFLCLILTCCKQSIHQTPLLSFKDSITQEYFKSIDSSEFHDTVNFDFKILRAYFKNDIPFFQQMQKDIEYGRKYGRVKYVFDSCVQVTKLSDLNVDEVYRFRHSESFCFYSQFVTISRKGDSIFLHYLEVSSSPDGKVIEYRDNNGYKKIGPGCRIEREFSKLLKMKEWELLKNHLATADYWLLKEREIHGCCDGSFWTIDGYTKRLIYYTGQQVHSVYRWSPQNSFADLGKLFMALAREKGMCNGIN